jgi:two-component system, OmpR family, sensor histidine kinase KdpD
MAGVVLNASDPNSTNHQSSTECLLSSTAHELRLPLSHIKGFVSSLRRHDVEWDAATRADFLVQIERETDRLTQMVDDLVDHSRGPQRVRRLHPVPTSPAALVAGGLDRVRGLLGDRRVEVAVPPGLPMVEVDAPAIERVLANLFDNALKYAPANSHIRVAAQVANGALELRVDDDGPGIPLADREQIFTRFFRGPNAQSSGQPGSGLGLAICLSIVSAHMGRIWADAGVGGGTRFTVSLPLRPLTAPPRSGRKPFPGRRGQAAGKLTGTFRRVARSGVNATAQARRCRY